MIKQLDQRLLDDLLKKAESTERKRVNLNWHPVLDDPVQRFFNAMLPETYVRPHRHVTPPRWEFFMVLQGYVALLVFDDEGVVSARYELRAGSDLTGIELAEGQWHAIVALEPSVLFELKEGQYAKVTDKDFATWAPEEGDAQCCDVVEWYRGAVAGDTLKAQ